MKTAKKVWMIILVSTVVIGLVPAISSMPVIAASGNGSNGKFIAPIEAPVAGSTPISNRAQLEAIRNNLYGNYYLTADIDLSGAEWVPIGTISGNAIEDTDISNFSGTFDGQGHVIRNMKITGEGYEWSGLFGYTYSATIKNVGMENTNISIARSAGAIAGGICGHACDTSISNCYNTGCVSASSLPCDYYTGAWSGGICGYTIESNIDSCYNTGSVSALSSNPVANPYAGGICGYFSDIYSIKNCYNTGSVTASYSSSVSEYWHSADAGGICGRCSANISNCYNAGTVSAFSSSAETTAGGICGSTVHSGAWGGPFGSVADCYNTGEVSASSPFSRVSEGLPYSAVGGICGYNTGEMNNCYNVGPLSASSAYTPSLGGICGSPVSSDEIGNCYCLNLYDNSYGKQLTSVQMTNAASFAGFDFNNIWNISASINNGYPYLREVLPDESASTPSAPAEATAKPTSSTVLVNGNDIAFDAYIVNDNNYFKLRDLAYILSGTAKQFEVTWDGERNAINLLSGKAYTAVGGEMDGRGNGDKDATLTTSTIYLDGEEINLTAYNISGNNYFKLRDIGAVLDFGVDWEGSDNTIVIDTSKEYTQE